MRILEERQVGGDAVLQARSRRAPRKIDWDGAKRVGRLVDGMYEAIVEATDPIATSTVALPFAADTRQPKLRIVQRSPLRIWVSEPARLTLRFGTRSLVYDARVAGTALGSRMRRGWGSCARSRGIRPATRASLHPSGSAASSP